MHRHVARHTIIIASFINYVGNLVVHLNAGVKPEVVVEGRLIGLPFDSPSL